MQGRLLRKEFGTTLSIVTKKNQIKNKTKKTNTFMNYSNENLSL